MQSFKVLKNYIHFKWIHQGYNSSRVNMNLNKHKVSLVERDESNFAINIANHTHIQRRFVLANEWQKQPITFWIKYVTHFNTYSISCNHTPTLISITNHHKNSFRHFHWTQNIFMWKSWTDLWMHSEKSVGHMWWQKSTVCNLHCDL
jgi:hypothetical protein